MTDLKTEFDLACPACGQAEELLIDIRALARVSAYGSEADGDQEWSDASYCRCPDCGHAATVAEFTLTPAPVPAEEPQPLRIAIAAMGQSPLAFTIAGTLNPGSDGTAAGAITVAGIEYAVVVLAPGERVTDG